jgi:hypothetical protein
MQDRAIPLPAERESDLRAAVRRFFKVAEYHCGLGRMLCRDTCPRHRALRDVEKLVLDA